MKGDHLYCKYCKKVYIDIENIHNTRTDQKFKPKCPWCGAWVSVNIEARLIGLAQFKQDKDKINIDKERHILKVALEKWVSEHDN